jgi:hypothetical protein
MKTMFRYFGFGCLAAFTAQATSTAEAQDGFTTGVTGRAGTNLRLFQSEGRALPMPGRIWVETNLGDGLGYDGSYFTLGGKTHLADDFLDGRWLMETQGHVSENGGFFGNLGVERVFSLKNAGADLTLGSWLDYDGDEVGAFSHTFWQAAFNGSIRTQKWDLVANAYIPLGDTVFTQGELGRVSFWENRVALRAGLDTALQGYDVTLRAKPMQFANYNGNVDVGLYGYSSDAIPYFTGIRTRAGLQSHNGWRLSGELNRDDLFGWTGVVQLGFTWGVNDRGISAGLGNDLDPTMRNDHIVRFQQEVVLAIDPDTGLPYNVIHVDNRADGTGIGTVESRFRSLADANAASAPDDIIFVHRGDGTTSFYDMGITLQDRQLLLGDGVQHIIPLAGGTAAFLPNVVNGLRPTITNNAGNAVRIDGSDTTVRGFIIDGTAPGTFMTNGILADGLVNPIDNFLIEDVEVRGAVLDGIRLENAGGNATFNRVVAQANGRDGISLVNYGDANADIRFRDVSVSTNGRDGVRFSNYDAATVQFLNSFSATGNFGHGVNLINFVDSAGVGAAYFFDAPVATGNVIDGIRIENANGNFRFENSTLTGNGGNGLSLINVRNTNPLHSTLITATPGVGSIFSGNAGSGIFVNLNQAAAVQRLRVEFSTLNGNNTGLTAQADGVGAFLTTDVIQNISIANNLKDGIFLRSINGGLNVATVTNVGARLNMNGNGAAGSGNGFTILAGDTVSVNQSTMIATISNISLQNIGLATSDSAVFAGTGARGLLDLNADNLLIANTGQGFEFDFNQTDPAVISRVRVLNSSVSFSAGIGMIVDNGAGSSADILVNNLLFQNDAAVQLGAAGVLFSNLGTMRTQFTNNTIDDFDAFGLVVQTGGAGRTLANVSGNTVTNNGPLNIANGIGDLPHEDGIRFLTTGNGVAHARFVNNVMTGNAQQGLNLTAAGTSTLTFSMSGNVIAANDQGGPFPPGPPAPDAFIRDMLSTNGVNANTNLAMSNNTFVFNADINNLSGAASYILELDGITNGVGFPTLIGGPVTNTAFGTVVEPAIQAEEAAFAGLGF